MSILPKLMFAKLVVSSRRMATEQIVALLIQERDRLNRAIEALQGPVKRQGRPSKNPSAEAPKKRRISAATRRKMALGQKRRWAAVNAAK